MIEKILWGDALAVIRRYCTPRLPNSEKGGWPVALAHEELAALQCPTAGLGARERWRALSAEVMRTCESGSLSALPLLGENGREVVSYLIRPNAFALWLLRSQQQPSLYVLAWFAHAPQLLVYDMEEPWRLMACSEVGWNLPMSRAQTHDAHDGPAEQDLQRCVDRDTPALDFTTAPGHLHSSDKSGVAQDVVHVSRLEAQKAAILAEIAKQGLDPLALPQYGPKKKGGKAAVRRALVGMHRLFQGTKMFERAWQELRDEKRIKYDNE